jgi:hypothetical protein
LPQFSNPFYRANGYTGSRILETNYTTNPYVNVTWWQIASIDSKGNVFIAQPERNSVIQVNATTNRQAFPVEGLILTGKSYRAGYRDGTLDVAEFNASQGIAVHESDTGTYLYVADTGNCVIRRVNLTCGAVDTIAGVAGISGTQDGDGRKALFSSPTSVGVDAISGLIFVQDGSLVRMINMTLSAVRVSTLVSGACHSTNITKVYSTIFQRTVRCQTTWLTTSSGSTVSGPGKWSWPGVCLGNEVTCTSRYDKAEL